jgi:hypothetical protein
MSSMISKSNKMSMPSTRSMVLLPLSTYRKLTKSIGKTRSKDILINVEKENFMAFASESSLAKDWLKSEEEVAWQNL